MHHFCNLISHFFRVIQGVVPPADAGVAETLDKIRIFPRKGFGGKQRIAVKIDPIIHRPSDSKPDALSCRLVGNPPEVLRNHVERPIGQVIKRKVPGNIYITAGLRRDSFAQKQRLKLNIHNVIQATGDIQAGKIKS